MAIVSDKWVLSVTLYDTGKNKSTLHFDLTGVDYATALTDKDAILASLINISDATIGQAFVSEKFVNDSFGLPAGDIQVEMKASLSGYVVGLGAEGANVKIPAPKQAIFQGTSGKPYNQVDMGNALVIAHEALFQTGGNAYISDGEVLAEFTEGKRIHAKSNRG